MEQIKERVKDKRVLTLFIILTLSFVVAIVGFIESNLFKVIIDILLIFLQTVIVKNILDDYYRY